MIVDIIRYLSKFLWRYDYTLLDKDCRDYYFRQNGINITDYHANLENTDLSILLKYDIIAKPKYHPANCIKFINRAGAENSVKKLRIAKCASLADISMMQKFPNVEYIWGVFSLTTFKNPDFFPNISKKNMTLYLSRNDIYNPEMFRNFEGKISADIIGINVENMNIIDSAIILSYYTREVPDNLNFDKLVKLKSFGRFINMIAPNLRVLMIWEDLKHVAAILTRHPKIEEIMGRIRIDDINYASFEEEYKRVYRYNVVRVISELKYVERLIELERECRRLQPRHLDKKTEIEIKYPFANNFPLREVITLFDVAIFSSNNFGLFYQLIGDIQRLERLEEVSLIKLGLWNPSGHVNFEDIIMEIFETKNILVTPYCKMDSPDRKIRQIERLREKYFG